MFCVPIIGPSFELAKNQILKANAQANLLEFRVDLFDESAVSRLKILKQLTSLPVIAKIDKKRFLEGFEWIDGPAGNLASYHNFQSTPADLESIYQQLPAAPLKKIACMTHSILDALRLVLIGQQHPDLLAMGMGELGLLTRVLGRPWRYAALCEQTRTAVAQPTIEELKRYATTGPLYGLIGNPVSQSPSHLTHNALLQHKLAQGCYLKMPLMSHEIKDFLPLAAEVGFQGLSVTAPLKEAILPYLQDIQTNLGAVNTLKYEKGGWVGFNTDAPALFDLLPPNTKRVILIGSGGSARAIGQYLMSKGLEVSVYSRSIGKALTFSHHQYPLEALEHVSGLGLINTLPVPLPVLPRCLQDCPFVIDITWTASALASKAESLHVPLKKARDLFVGQAALQFKIWQGWDERACACFLDHYLDLMA
jgi:3-dehydroquinate dehydratase/shikimate dehydrogenase